MAFRRCNGIVVHHEVTGDPSLPAMVFANSLGTDLRVWDAVLAHFAGRFRLVRYDKRGHGLTDNGTDPFSIAPVLENDVAAEVVTAGGAFVVNDINVPKPVPTEFEAMAQ